MNQETSNGEAVGGLGAAPLLGQFWRMDYIPHNQKAALEIEGDRYGLDHPWAGMWIVCPKDEERKDYGVYGYGHDWKECKAEFDKLEASGALP
jgi:hypothetical protein